MTSKLKCMHCGMGSNPFKTLDQGVKLLVCNHPYHEECLQIIWKFKPDVKSFCPTCTESVGVILSDKIMSQVTEVTSSVLPRSENTKARFANHTYQKPGSPFVLKDKSPANVQSKSKMSGKSVHEGPSTESFWMGYDRNQKVTIPHDGSSKFNIPDVGDHEEPLAKRHGKKRSSEITQTETSHLLSGTTVYEAQVSGAQADTDDDWITCYRCVRGNSKTVNTPGLNLICGCFFHLQCLQSLWKNCSSLLDLCPRCKRPAHQDMLTSLKPVKSKITHIQDSPSEQIQQSKAASGTREEKRKVEVDGTAKIGTTLAAYADDESNEITSEDPQSDNSHNYCMKKYEGKCPLHVSNVRRFGCRCCLHLMCLLRAYTDDIELYGSCPMCFQPIDKDVLLEIVNDFVEDDASGDRYAVVEKFNLNESLLPIITEKNASDLDEEETASSVVLSQPMAVVIPEAGSVISSSVMSSSNVGIFELDMLRHGSLFTVVIEDSANATVSAFGISRDLKRFVYTQDIVISKIDKSVTTSCPCCVICGFSCKLTPPATPGLYRRKPNHGSIVLACDHQFHLSCLTYFFEHHKNDECPSRDCKAQNAFDVRPLNSLPEGWRYIVRETHLGMGEVIIFEDQPSSSSVPLKTDEANPSLSDKRDDKPLGKDKIQTSIQHKSGILKTKPAAFEAHNCCNCRSRYHVAERCPNPVNIKMYHLSPPGVPQEFKVQFTTEGQIQGSIAGDILSSIKKEIHWRKSFSGPEIQMIYSFVFFNFSCWRCASPYHGNYGCRVQLNMPENLNKLRKELFNSRFKFGSITKPCECPM